MSRHEFNNQQYTVVVGVDHVTGAFVQVLEHPGNQDGPNLVIDNLGVRTWNLPECLTRKVEAIKEQFAAAKRIGNRHPNIYPQLVVEIVACLDRQWARQLAPRIYAILD
jgi:hypothetical protein